MHPFRQTLAAVAVVSALLLVVVAPPTARAFLAPAVEPGNFQSRIDGQGQERVMAMTRDAAGNVYVVGGFTSADVAVETYADYRDSTSGQLARLEYRTAENTAPGTSDAFVTKYDKDGAIVWTRAGGGTGNDFATGIAVDADGNVFITGHFQNGNARFGVQTLATKPPASATAFQVQENLFVAMLDRDGLWRWARALEFDLTGRNATTGAALGNAVANVIDLTSGSYGLPGNALAMDADKNLYLKGYVAATSNLTFNQSAANTTYVGRLKVGASPGFTVVASRSLNTGSTYRDSAFVVKLGRKTASVGSTANELADWEWKWGMAANEDPIIDSNGTIPSAPNAVAGLTVDANGALFAAGAWGGRLAFGGAPVTSTFGGGKDGFVARLNTSDGTPLFLSKVASTSEDAVTGLVVDDNRNVYVCGNYGNAALSFTPVPAGTLGLPAQASSDIFLGKLSPSGQWLWAESPGGNAILRANALTRDVAGALYVTGSLRGPLSTATFGAFSRSMANSQAYGAIQAGICEPFVAKLNETNATTRTWAWVQGAPVDPALDDPRETDFQVSIYDDGRFHGSAVVAAFGETFYWLVSSGDSMDRGTGLSSQGETVPYYAVSSRFRTDPETLNGNTPDVVRTYGAFLFPMGLDGLPLPKFNKNQTVFCGQEVPVPGGVYLDPANNNRPLQPEIVLPGTTTSAAGSFYWDTFSRKLFAVSPTLANVRWRISGDLANPARLDSVVSTVWPTTAPGLVTQVTGAGVNNNEPKVSLEPSGASHTFSSILYQDNGGAVEGAKLFSANREGYAVLLYTVGANTAAGSAPAALTVIRTRLWTNAAVRATAAATVGTAVEPGVFTHADPEGKTGYVVSRRARIDAVGADAAYQFATQKGPIIPVNVEEVTTATPPADADPADDLNVIWSTLDAKGIGWPSRCVRYTAAWPANPEKIVIASQLGNEMDKQGNVSYALSAGDDNFFDYTASDGTRFRRDTIGSGGATFRNVVPIADTTEDPLYQYGRAGADFSYAFNVPNARYLVTLYFTEPASGPSGQRTMNVDFEGARVLPNLNVLTRTGGNDRALAITLPATVADGVLNIRFTAAPGATQALVNAIKVAAAEPQDRLEPAAFANPVVYHQPDRTAAGYNPNEEHALLVAPNLPEGTSAGGRLAVFALRNDLNNVGTSPTSAPYTLVRYQDAAAGLKTKFKVYQVLATDTRYGFSSFNAVAGTRLLPPYPLSLLPEGAGTTGSGVPYFKDRKNQVWAKSDGPLVARYFYGLQPNFWYDVAAPFGVADSGVTDVPWLDRISGGTVGTPIAVNYACTWPPNIPVLAVGDTVTTQRDGLPGVENWGSATVIYEQSNAGIVLSAANSAVRILDYTERRVVGITSTPAPVVDGQNLVIGALTFPVERDLATGFYRFTNLPFHLKSRLLYAPQGYVNPSTQVAGPGLILSGYKDATSYAGRPLLLLNILSLQERDRLLALDGASSSVETPWDVAVNALYRLARNPNGVDNDNNGSPDDAYYAGFAKTGSSGPLRHADALGPKALTAGKAAGSLGYVTLVENNAPALGAASVALHIIKVENPPVTGDLKVIFSDNPLDEKITVRHGADFAGDPSALTFEWFYQAATSATPPAVPNAANPTGSNGWLALNSGVGINDHTFEGASLTTLADSWVYCRYKGYNTNGYNANTYGSFAGDPSGGATSRPVFVPGWIKRVLSGLNPFEARVKNFASAPTQTYSSVLVSAGARYEGDVALNSSADNLNSIGLISLYETALRRGLKLSINGSGQTNAAVNQSLLLAATRVSDLYMLAANEAYADAQDPTIGFTTASGEVGSLAPSVFAFANQVPALMQEELALLRGRDNSSAGVGAAPVYNRLFWNFTAGLEGEPVYTQNYGITDQNFDGFINQADARTLFPQGHGDAWGHYLSAMKGHYRLLRHPLYSWSPNTENTLIAGVAVEVDYLDERKFAAAAAAKATAGAEIVNLTYRDSYTADPAGQWQGYRDSDRNRAWGTDDWARRAGQGAYLDWATANAILPAIHAKLLHNPIVLPAVDDPSDLTPTNPPATGINPNEPAPTGLQKIDRTTVADLAKIAAAFGKIQAQMDQADQGLNPLGVTPGTIPFDIDPTFNEVSSGIQGTTHFEQIFGRTMAAVNNARGIFDYANELTNRLRQTQLSADGFAQDVLEQERDFNARLIEIFGYPYAGDIGGGKLYPTGYNGPDLYHYNYVAVNTVSGTAVVPDTSFSGFFAPFAQEFKAPPGGATNATSFTEVYSHYFPNDNTTINPVNGGAVLTVPFPVATAASWSFAAPASWGVRRAPGTLQLAISDMVRAEAELRRGLSDYNNHIANIQDQIDLLVARSGLQADNIQVLNRNRDTIIGLNAAVGVSRAVATATGVGADLFSDISEATSEAIPKSVGLATDAFAPVRGVIKLAGALGYNGLKVAGGVASIAADAFELSKEQVGLATDIEIQKNDYAFEVREQLKVIEALLREDVGLRLDLFNLQNSLRDAFGQYQITLAEADRLLEDRLVYRKKVAGVTQQNRYQDITFRVFRNDALQKYRAAFDLAARYTYLAATTYDYETCQLGSNNAAGRRFLTDIVKERALGQFNGNGDPVVGVNGLSDPLARLTQNFQVLESRLGLNNPQYEGGQFSLRNELFRILPENNADWQDQLQAKRVPDLWAVPEFRRFCRPFAPESAGAQPGIVIPFSANVNFGLNFFGLPLGGGDSSYDSTQYVTKIKSVGVSFGDYNAKGLSNTPRVYLVPAGLDVMRAPNDATLSTREFDVVDQAIPVPFPVGTSALQNPNYIPSNDSLDTPFNTIRQFSRFRAYPYSGQEDPAQLVSDTRLIGRSVWNTKWLLIIPGGTLLNNATEGLDTFVRGPLVPNSTTQRDGNGINDIKLFFETYSYSGN